jgi:hypothetical protein
MVPMTYREKEIWNDGYAHGLSDSGAIKVLAQSEKGEERYNKLRKLNPRQFHDLVERNLKGENFDQMVDSLK